MRLYLEYVKNSFKVNLAYRVDSLLSIVKSILSIFVSISIWVVLYGKSNNVQSNNGLIELSDMITYVICSTGMSILISNGIIGIIDRKIQTGEIAMDLIKPMNFKLFLLFDTIGSNLYKFVFTFLPFFVTGLMLFKFKVPSLKTVFFYFISIGNGFIILFLLSYVIALTGFWYLSVWQFERMLQDAVKLLSGAFVPLWFFPGFLLKISEFLPFRYIYFEPLSLYLKNPDIHISILILLKQFGWIMLLLVLEKLIWKKAVTKLSVQGG